MRYFDAHNHLQDARFADRQDELVAAAIESGVARMVVNGTREADWPQVAELAQRHSQVLPSFGCHPWYLGERTPNWRTEMVRWLETVPGAVIGEIGLDRWIVENAEQWRRKINRSDVAFTSLQPPSLAEQEDAFLSQLALAAERNLPVSIHCLQAFGRMHELLQTHPRPACGFLLHSYSGPVDLVAPFAKLGAYFSFSGHFAHERKLRQRETFRAVPPDRLLVETDAPDQLPPAELNDHPFTDIATGESLNQPANLPAVHRFLARFLGEPVEALATRVAANFTQLYGGLGNGGLPASLHRVASASPFPGTPG